jgi:hypothetical protein
MLLVNRAFARWIVRDNALFWLGIVLPLTVVAFVGWYWWGSDLSIRWAGYFLSLLGALGVFRSVVRAQRSVNPLSLRKRLGHHLGAGIQAARDSRIAADIVLGTGSAFATGFAPTLTISGWRNLHDRVEILETKLEQVADAVVAERTARENAVAAVRKEAADARTAHQAQFEHLARRLDDATTGDWMFQMAGVSWIIIGQACTTFPLEISRHIPLDWLMLFRS